MRVRFGSTMLLVVAFAALAIGQQQDKPLTNSDIVNMAKVGLGESTIVLAIHDAPSMFDVSPAALIDLKNQGVSQGVLDAMLTAKSGAVAPAAPRAAPAVSNAVPGLPADPGVYYKGPAGWIRLEQAVPTGSKAGGIGSFAAMAAIGPFAKVKAKSVYDGPLAPLQITDSKPMFYVRSAPGAASRSSHRYFGIVQLEQKKDRRELQVASASGFSASGGYNKKDLRETVVTDIAPEILGITPNSDLGLGEYLLCVGATYDFGVRADAKQ